MDLTSENSNGLRGKLGLGARVSFAGPLAARTAFVPARCVVVPSSLEFVPNVVIEAAAAHMPLIATSIGGIPEIMGNIDMLLVPGGDVGALAASASRVSHQPAALPSARGRVQRHVAAKFTVDNMTYEVVDFDVSEFRAGTQRAD